MSLLLDKLLKAVEKYPHNDEYISDCFNLIANLLKKDKDLGMLKCAKLKSIFNKHLQNNVRVKDMYNNIFKVLCLETPYSLDSYFQALEWERPIKERFYYPRRKQLLHIVKELEKLLITDEIDELFLSCPARIGKTTLVVFAMSWLIGMDSERSNLYVSHSTTVVNTFYDGLMEILIDKFTYCWDKVFPNAKFDKNTMCNAKETCFDVDRKKRYHSFTGRSIDSSLNGSCDCNGLLVSDDLVSGIEEAQSPERLASKWDKVNNDMISRAKESAKKLWIGTRWNAKDPIGVRLSILEAQKNSRYSVCITPALNKDDESNFDYLFNVGFSTDYYKQVRSSYTNTNKESDWLIQYQCEPVERKGLLIPSDRLHYCSRAEMMKLENTRRIAFCDPAFGGGDFTSMPCAYVSEGKVYIIKWVHDDSAKEKTEPKIAQALKDYKIARVCFEANNGGTFYKEQVEEMLKKDNYKCLVECQCADNQISKEDNIYANSGDIIENFVFLNPDEWDNDYRNAMTQMTTYLKVGRVKHDDANDSISKLNIMVCEVEEANAFEILSRPF